MENLNDIVIFVAVVQAKGFSAAARQLNLSPSYVSKRVRSLEESLETQLLKRSTHYLSLTELGEAFFRQCTEALDLLQGARTDVLERAEHIRGTLRVFAALGFGEYVLWRLVAEFARQFPEINVELGIGLRATNVLETGSDIAIRSADLPDSSLERRELGVLNYHICAAPGYLAQAGTPATPRDLPRFNCLIHTAHHPADRWKFSEGGREIMVDVTGNLRSNSGVVIHGACMEGLGIARLPHYIVEQELRRGTLTELFHGRHLFQRSLKAFYPRSKHVPTKITTFLDFIEARLRADSSANPATSPAITSAPGRHGRVVAGGD